MSFSLKIATCSIEQLDCRERVVVTGKITSGKIHCFDSAMIVSGKEICANPLIRKIVIATESVFGTPTGCKLEVKIYLAEVSATSVKPDMILHGPIKTLGH